MRSILLLPMVLLGTLVAAPVPARPSSPPRPPALPAAAIDPATAALMLTDRRTASSAWPASPPPVTMLPPQEAAVLGRFAASAPARPPNCVLAFTRRAARRDARVGRRLRAQGGARNTCDASIVSGVSEASVFRRGGSTPPEANRRAFANRAARSVRTSRILRSGGCCPATHLGLGGLRARSRHPSCTARRVHALYAYALRGEFFEALRAEKPSEGKSSSATGSAPPSMPPPCGSSWRSTGLPRRAAPRGRIERFGYHVVHVENALIHSDFEAAVERVRAAVAVVTTRHEIEAGSRSMRRPKNTNGEPLYGSALRAPCVRVVVAPASIG